MGYWTDATRTIRYSDVLLYILDARMPELSRNEDLEEKLESSGKEYLTVFNKIDLIPRDKLDKIKKKNKGAFFVSVDLNLGVKKLRLELLKIAKKMNLAKLEIGMVGYPNVGKSAITNILSRAAKTKVSSKAGTTTGTQWASSTRFKILDSPGVIPSDDEEMKLGVLGAKNPEKLRDPESVALEIIRMFLKEDVESLEKFYKFSFEKGDDEYEVLIKIGEARNLLRKGGVVDEKRAWLVIIKDWQKGKLRILN